MALSLPTSKTSFINLSFGEVALIDQYHRAGSSEELPVGLIDKYLR